MPIPRISIRLRKISGPGSQLNGFLQPREVQLDLSAY